MSDVQTCAAGVRKLDQGVKFGFRRVFFYFENVIIVPIILPFLFYRFKIVFFRHSETSFLIFLIDFTTFTIEFATEKRYSVFLCNKKVRTLRCGTYLMS